jgi:hypothetical protein
VDAAVGDEREQVEPPAGLERARSQAASSASFSKKLPSAIASSMRASPA